MSEWYEYTVLPSDVIYENPGCEYTINEANGQYRLVATDNAADHVVVTYYFRQPYNYETIMSETKRMDFARRFVFNEQHLRALNGRTEDYYLTRDIACAGVWVPIATFDGYFGGNEHTITLTLQATAASELSDGLYGLFARNSGTIANLNVNASIVIGDDVNRTVYAGVIAAINEAGGFINNCTVNDDGKIAQIICGKENSVIGGIVGLNYGKILNCDNHSQLVTLGDAGGIAGQSSGSSSSIHYCKNHATIGYGSLAGARSVGGIVGYLFGGATLAANVNSGIICYLGEPSESRTLQPHMGQIVGHATADTNRKANTCRGEVDPGNLKTVTWTEGSWWNKKEYSHNQAAYVSNGEIGCLT